MEMRQITPGCYYDTASKWDKNLISTHDFFSKTLSHLGTADARVHHPEDTNPVDQQLNPLFWKGTFGPIAAAIKLCESDALAEAVNVQALVSLFVACTIKTQTIESIRTSDSQNVLASPLLRQALIVTALKAGHASLVRELIYHAPTIPPPCETCVFKMKPSSLIDDEKVSAGVWAALVATGWALPSSKLALWAASASNGPDGVALFDAIAEAGFDMHANLMYKETLPSLALVTSEPEVLKYLFDLCSVSPTSDMLIQAIELREKGGVEVLRWLLDTHKLDVNYVRQGLGPFDTPTEVGDPRNRAEREYALSQNERSQKPRTALHAATLRGNTEACEFLLERGALSNAGESMQQ